MKSPFFIKQVTGSAKFPMPLILAIWLVAAGHCAAAAPYPASLVITNVTFHWSSWRGRNLAPGSDNWPCTWSDDDNIYTSFGDGGGFGGNDNTGRSGIGVARVQGPSSAYTGVNVFGGLNPQGSDRFTGYSDPNAYYYATYSGVVRATGKSRAILSLGGVLYMWCSPLSGTNGYIEMRLARSVNKGTNFALENWSIPGRSGPSSQVVQAAALQFGKDYAGVPPHAAGYVYLYFIGLKNASALQVQTPGAIYLARVPADDASLRNSASYQWYASTNTNPAWSSTATDRKPVFQDTNGVGWCSSVSYNAGLARYILITEHTATYQGNVGLFESTRPWGPWRTIAYLDLWRGPPSDTSGSQAFYWNVPNKWVSRDGRSFTLTCTGVNGDDSWNIVDGTFAIADTAVGAPAISVMAADGESLTLGWPDPSAGWVLQENSDLSTTNWTASALPIEIQGTNKCVIVAPYTGKRFYRLQKSGS